MAMENLTRVLAQSLEEVRPLHCLCKEGRLYAVEQWITEGKPVQIDPQALGKRVRPKTALQITLETGQHSLTELLLRRGYRLDLERYRPLELALQLRRWDLFDLLLEWGGDLHTVEVSAVLETYNIDLYERFRLAGYDLTKRHEMASVLGHGTSNRPLYGFAKKHRSEDPAIQRELNLALGYQAREGNARGVALCLWAGADAHAHPTEDELPEDGWSAIEAAAYGGHLEILKRLGPDPARDDFDHVYGYAKSGAIVSFLTSIKPPQNMTAILFSQLPYGSNSSSWLSSAGLYRGAGVIEALLDCHTRWADTDAQKLNHIRRLLLDMPDCALKRIMSRLRHPEVCAIETYQELTRTPSMQARLFSFGLIKKVMSEQEKRGNEILRLLSRYDRGQLYEQIWSRPVQEVAKTYGISDVRLGKVCRTLQVPVPPRGYWARVQAGYKGARPHLPKLSERHVPPRTTSAK